MRPLATGSGSAWRDYGCGIARSFSIFCVLPSLVNVALAEAEIPATTDRATSIDIKVFMAASPAIEDATVAPVSASSYAAGAAADRPVTPS